VGNSFPAGNKPRSEFIANVCFGHAVVHFFILTLAGITAGNIIARSEQRTCTPGKQSVYVRYFVFIEWKQVISISVFQIINNNAMNVIPNFGRHI